MPAAPGKNILIVEDEWDVVDLLTLNLRRAGGFNVSTATDGIAGLQTDATRSRANHHRVGDHATNIGKTRFMLPPPKTFATSRWLGSVIRVKVIAPGF